MQMKPRVFEVPATGAALLTEHTEELENCFDIGKEILTFKTHHELIDKVNFLSRKPGEVEKISSRGFERVKADHDSKIRLRALLEKIV